MVSKKTPLLMHRNSTQYTKISCFTAFLASHAHTTIPCRSAIMSGGWQMHQHMSFYVTI